MSGFGVFMLILVIVAIIYFVGGILILKFLRGATGIEMIPNHEFWCGLPHSIRVIICNNYFTFRIILHLCFFFKCIKLHRGVNIYFSFYRIVLIMLKVVEKKNQIHMIQYRYNLAN